MDGMDVSYAKSARLIYMYAKLMNGDSLDKNALAERFHVTGKSVQRDIDELRCFFSDEALGREIIYNRQNNCYSINGSNGTQPTGGELYALCKILLGVRPFSAKEMSLMLEKLMNLPMTGDDRSSIRAMISSENFAKNQTGHREQSIPTLWNMACAAKKRLLVEIRYDFCNRLPYRTWRIAPLETVFLGKAFYIIGYTEDKIESGEEPRAFAVERIQSYIVTQNHFRLPNSSITDYGVVRRTINAVYSSKPVTATFSADEDIGDSMFSYAEDTISADGEHIVTAEAVTPREKKWLLDKAGIVPNNK